MQEVNYPNLSLLLKGLRSQKDNLIEYKENRTTILYTGKPKAVLLINIKVRGSFNPFFYTFPTDIDQRISLDDIETIASKLNTSRHNKLFTLFKSLSKNPLPLINNP